MPGAVRVYIATTQGSVEIENIKDSPPGWKSFVLVNQSSSVVHLEPPYYAFIQKETGLIARCFGEKNFRLELSEKIDMGSSWQLGVFVAHALHHQGRLAKVGEVAATAVWATGTVDYDFGVGGILHLPKKIATLEPDLRDPPPTLVVHAVWPKKNGAEVSASVRDTLVRVNIHEIEDARDVLTLLGLDPVRDERSATMGSAEVTAVLTTPGLTRRSPPTFPDLVPAALRAGAFICALTIEMLLLYGLRSSAPPWPEGTFLATVAVVAMVLLGTSIFGRRDTLRTRSKSPWLLALMTGSLFVVYFYSAAYFIIVDKESNNERHPAVVGGFVCQELKQEYFASQKVKCPWLGMDQIREDEYAPERFWTPQSIYQARMILLLSWFGSFISLSSLAGLFLRELDDFAIHSK